MEERQNHHLSIEPDVASQPQALRLNVIGGDFVEHCRGPAANSQLAQAAKRGSGIAIAHETPCIGIIVPGCVGATRRSREAISRVRQKEVMAEFMGKVVYAGEPEHDHAFIAS